MRARRPRATSAERVRSTRVAGALRTVSDYPMRERARSSDAVGAKRRMLVASHLELSSRRRARWFRRWLEAAWRSKVRSELGGGDEAGSTTTPATGGARRVRGKVAGPRPVVGRDPIALIRASLLSSTTLWTA